MWILILMKPADLDLHGFLLGLVPGPIAQLVALYTVGHSNFKRSHDVEGTGLYFM